MLLFRDFLPRLRAGTNDHQVRATAEQERNEYDQRQASNAEEVDDRIDDGGAGGGDCVRRHATHELKEKRDTILRQLSVDQCRG